MLRRFRVIFLLSIFIPISTYAQEKLDSSRFGDYLENDLEGFTSSISIKNIFYTGGTTAALYFLSLKDEDILHAVQKQNYGWKKKYFDITNEFGNPLYVLPGAFGIFGISMFTDNTKFQDASFTSFESVVVSLAIVGGIKCIVGRARPLENRGAHTFNPFNLKKNYHSFPSGHSSTAFSSIIPWIVYYPNALTYSLLLVPTGTALARIAKNKHWLTDVIAGGVIGGLTGYYLARSHEDTGDELESLSSKGISIPIVFLQLSF